MPTPQLDKEEPTLNPELEKAINKCARESTNGIYVYKHIVDYYDQAFAKAEARARQEAVEEDRVDILRMAKDLIGHHCDKPNCDHNLEVLIKVLESLSSSNKEGK
ncbi:hypothetical protein KBC79_01440 [Candidatus Woesebacteria bacterium]|nr:hypothetical protein [Candidatus Woesebacteria bacterium]